MIDPDELSDSESAKVLEGFDIAESGHWIEQLDWYVHPWLIHVDVWQKPLQYFKVISLQLK